MFSTILCWIWPLIAGVLCGILGYLLGRIPCSSSSKKDNMEDRYDKLKYDYEKLTAALNTCKSDKIQLEKDLKNCISSRASIKTPENKENTKRILGFDAEKAQSVFGKKIKQDDLKVIEGIGPKIEELFQNNDIKTWKELSVCSFEKCKEILKSGGDRFKMHNPATWPNQAKMAFEGKWEELLKWQDQLDGGK